MYYIPNNTYIHFPSLDLRYDALLQELSCQSREMQGLRNKAASFNEDESRLAKRKLRKIIESIMDLRGLAQES